MILFTEEDRQMLKHVVDVVGDRLHHEDGYTDEDRQTLDKLEKLTKTPATAVVLTGEELEAESRQLMQAIVRAELAHWVPVVSTRLIYRAGRALGITQPHPGRGAVDCGPERASHALTRDWVAGLYLMRCVSCFRLYED